MKKGFTLIEMAVSIFLTSAITVFSAAFLITAVRMEYSISRRIKILDNVSSAFETIKEDIRLSKEIVRNSNENNLVLYLDPDIISYSLKDKKIKRTKNSFVQYLTGDDTISSLKFSYINERLVQIAIKPEHSGEYFHAKAGLRN